MPSWRAFGSAMTMSSGWPRLPLQFCHDEVMSESLGFGCDDVFHLPRRPLSFSYYEVKSKSPQFSCGDVFHLVVGTTLIQPWRSLVEEPLIRPWQSVPLVSG